MMDAQIARLATRLEGLSIWYEHLEAAALRVAAWLNIFGV